MMRNTFLRTGIKTVLKFFYLFYFLLQIKKKQLKKILFYH